MFRKFKLNLISPHCGLTLEFEWDAEAGVFSGPDGPEVERMIARALGEGIVYGHPYPTPYEITDPAHKAADLAVVLGQFWRLPRELARAYPKPPPDDTPPGAVN